MPNEDYFESMALAVKTAVESGMKSVLEKIEPRLVVLEGKESVTIEAIHSAIKEAVDAIEIPIPKDGVDGKDGQDGKDGVDGAAGVDGKNGYDGRDAVDIEILPEIDTDKSYSRGTFASHNGGLWRSFEKTHGMRGWECIVSGVAEIDVEYDGERKAVFKIKDSHGAVVEKEVVIPALIHKGIWVQGEQYTKGDFVQLSGSMWFCKADTDSRPMDDSECWQLAVKRGGTGDSAYNIARKNGFEGTVLEWLDSLGKKPKVGV